MSVVLTKVFDCPLCTYTSDRKANLQRHLMIHVNPKDASLCNYTCHDCQECFINKIHWTMHMQKYCKKGGTRQTIVTVVEKCPQCHKEFTSRSNLNRHLKNSHASSTPHALPQPQQMNTYNIQIINNNDIQINNKIQINNFGQEDISHIKDEEIFAFMKRVTGNGLVDLLKRIHTLPENRTIQLHSKKQNLVKIHDNGEWCYQDTSYAIDKMIEKGTAIMQHKYNEENSRIKYEDEKDYDLSILKGILDVFSKEPSRRYKHIFRQIYIYILNVCNSEGITLVERDV